MGVHLVLGGILPLRIPTPFAATWMDLENIMLSEITYIWNLKNNANERIFKTETDIYIENKLVVTKGERQGGGAN